MDFPCYFINRDVDFARRKRIEHSGRKKGYRLIRVAAVDGYAPDFAERYAGRIGGTVSRGTQACFLSHARAWRAIAEGDAPFGMVCEDDARFLRPAADVADFAAKLGPEFDIIFVNSRAGLYQVAAGGGQGDDVARLHVAYDLAMQRPRGPDLPHYSRLTRDMKAPGGDGYLLSREGAARLLAALEHEVVASDVDCWLFFKCLPRNLLRRHRKRFLVRVMAEARVPALRAPLRGGISGVALVDPHPISRRSRARNPLAMPVQGRDMPARTARGAKTRALASLALAVEFRLSDMRPSARARLLNPESVGRTAAALPVAQLAVAKARAAGLALAR